MQRLFAESGQLPRLYGRTARFLLDVAPEEQQNTLRPADSVVRDVPDRTRGRKGLATPAPATLLPRAPAREPGGVILAIDDDPDTLVILRLILEREGMVVDTATSREAALNRAATRPPAVIILDWQVTSSTAAVIARGLRDIVGPVVPIVLISGDMFLEEKAHLVGAFDYVQKPIARRELVRTVHRALASTDPEYSR